MKIGIIINYLDNLAPATASFEQSILKALRNSGSKHQFVIFTQSKITAHTAKQTQGFESIEISKYGFRIKHVGLRNLVSRIHVGMARIFLKPKFLSIVNYYRSNALNKALIASKIDLVWAPYSMEEIDIPNVLTVLDVNYRLHPFLPEEHLTYKAWRTHNEHTVQAVQRASFIISSTKAGKNELISHFNVDPAKIRVIPFFVPNLSELSVPERSVSSLNESELPARFLFYPARLLPHKNHITILKALKCLKDDHDIRIDLVFVGSDMGNLPYVLSKAKEFNLCEQIHYYGKISFTDLQMLYKKAFALVYASINGPDNLPPLEAFDNGCPVIASKLAGSEEQFGDAALVFEKLDHADLAEKIRQLLFEQGLRETLIRKGFERVRSNTAERYVSSVLSIFSDYENYAELWPLRSVVQENQ